VRDREREKESVCMIEREFMRVCVRESVCDREKEREREFVRDRERERVCA
jgi:hypothetical protein